MKLIKLEKKYYVSHILLNGETIEEEIQKINPRFVDPKEEAIGFIMYEGIVAEVLDDEEEIIILRSEARNQTGTYYTKGVKLNRVEVINSFPNEKNVIEHMEKLEEILKEPPHVVNVGEYFFVFKPRDKMYKYDNRQ